MRVLLSHPYCWPYVRRGSERFLAELARYLNGRGHDVTSVSTKPGPAADERGDFGRRILHSERRWPGALGARIRPDHLFIAPCLRTQRMLRPEVVHAMHYTDGLATRWARRWNPHRYVFQMNGPPIPHLLSPRIPPDRWIFRQAATAADIRVVISRFCQQTLDEHYGLDAEVLPIPVDLQAFVPKDAPPAGPPTFLFVGSVDDIRKNARTLMRAFGLVLGKLPESRLIFSGQASAEKIAELRSSVAERVASRVEFLGVGQLTDLPRLYREAHVMVLPSMWEAFGMVFIEAWASGTPVVGARHAGPAEMIDDPRVGLLFDPKSESHVTEEAESLAEAMIDAFPWAERPETIERCRQKAAGYSWEVVGPRYESLYTET